MQTVSTEFLTAINATEREIRKKVELVLLDNSMLGVEPSYDASSTLDATITPASLAFNGKVTPQRKFGYVSPYVFPASDLYPVASDGSSEIGWWSDTIATPVAATVEDAFARSGALHGSTADTGQTWTAVVGGSGWATNGSCAVYVSGFKGLTSAIATVVAPKGIYEVTITTPAALTTAMGIAFRVVDRNSHFAFTCAPGDTDNVTIRKVVSN